MRTFRHITSGWQPGVRRRRTGGQATSWPHAEDWEWLQMSMLRQVAVATLLLGWLWWLCLLEQEGLRPWYGAMALMAAGGVTWLACGRLRYRYAAGSFLFCLACALAVIIALHPQTPAGALIGLLAGAAGLLVSPPLGLAIAAALALGLGAAALEGLLPMPLAVVSAGIAIGIGLLARAGSQPLQTVLHWSWMSYEQARQKTDALMEQRGQLQQTLKDLNLAYDRLEKMSAELERARQAAVEARRLKAEFAANVSHELRTPLNLIIGFSEMMFLAPQTYGGVALPAPYRGDVEAIYRSARHLSQLIDDVLDLSQVEAGRMGLVKEPISAAEVAREAMNTVGHLFERKQLSLTLQAAPDLPPILADRTRVRQVLMNLLNNAARFTDLGGVTIRVFADGQAVTTSVKDTGVGIAPADMSKVFEEFRQLDGSTRRRQGGSGLGLAISRKFVDLHGGRMWVESSGTPGEGTTFSFSLPVEESQPISEPASWETWARPTDWAGHKTLIVIDPHGQTRRLFERYVLGYTVLTVANLAEAQHQGAREPVHAFVLVTDRLDAATLAGEPFSIPGFPDVPVLSCLIRQEDRAENALGVAGYLVKPILRERFLATLESLGDKCRNLLLVDDEPEVIRMLTRMIRSARRRYTLRSAFDGEEAWGLLMAHRPDAVVLDLLMPRVDGYTLLARMRGDPRMRDVPVIVVTAGGSDRERTSASWVLLSRQNEFSVGELMRYVQGGLDALRPPALLHTGPAQPAATTE